MKRCFQCKWKLPLFMYQKTKVNHLLRNDSMQERVFVCRICEPFRRPTYEDFKRVIAERDELAKENRQFKKYLNDGQRKI